MKKNYCLCAIFLTLFLIGTTVLFVQGFNSNSAVTEQSKQVNNQMPNNKLNDELTEQTTSKPVFQSDEWWDEQYKEIAQNYTGSDLAGFFAQVKADTERISQYNRDPTGPSSSSSSATENTQPQNPQNTPAKGHWEEQSQYWDPWIEQWVPVFKWVPE